MAADKYLIELQSFSYLVQRWKLNHMLYLEYLWTIVHLKWTINKSKKYLKDEVWNRSLFTYLFLLVFDNTRVSHFISVANG